MRRQGEVVRKVVGVMIAAALSGGSLVAVSAQAAHATTSAGPDYNCDGYADLAVGVPGGTVNGGANQGFVLVFWGTNGGLDPRASVLHIGAGGAAGTAMTGDVFGSAVASGNFDGDQCDDLAVSAPGVDVGAQTDAGVVYMYFGKNGAPGFDTTRTRRFVRGAGGVPGTSQRGAQWGWSLSAGDANGDFTDDLAIGAPLDDVNGVVDAGSVTVLQDPGVGNTATGSTWSEGVGGVPGTPSTAARFGAAVAFGNFAFHDLSDFSQELAIGVPGEDADGVTDSGAVDVLAADGSGVTGTGATQITQNTAGVPDSSETSDRFGGVLAAGSFLGGDDPTDLAIGAPWEDIGSVVDAGAVTVLGGSATGLLGAGAPPAQFFYEGTGNIPNLAESGDRFGSALAVAHFDGNGADADLAIGAPYEDVGSIANAGAIAVVPSNAGTLDVTHSQYLWQGFGGVPGVSEPGDRFGTALTAGDFAASGVDELAVGVPNEDVGTLTDAGDVVLLGSDGTKLHPATAGGHVLDQNVAGVPGNPAVGARFGTL